MVRVKPLKAKTSEPRFERVSDERCPDCEYNGWLSNEGFSQRGMPHCGVCDGGRINLRLWEEILSEAERAKDKAKKLETLVKRINRGRTRIVRPSDLLDPYLIRKKG